MLPELQPSKSNPLRGGDVTDPEPQKARSPTEPHVLASFMCFVWGPILSLKSQILIEGS